MSASRAVFQERFKRIAQNRPRTLDAKTAWLPPIEQNLPLIKDIMGIIVNHIDVQTMFQYVFCRFSDFRESEYFFLTPLN
jgi:hypothetical protein